MENIRKLFLTKTIPDLISEEFDMPYIKFIFDKETLKHLKDYLDVYLGIKIIHMIQHQSRRKNEKDFNNSGFSFISTILNRM